MTATTVRTVAVTKVGDLRSTDEAHRGEVDVVDLPAAPLGPDDVRLDVAYAGICGSDPHVAEGFFGTDVPIGLGHEISGVVTELGERAAQGDLAVGDRAAGNFIRFCGACVACLDGRQQFCEHIQDYNRPGMAESIVWHRSQAYRLPDGVPLRHGALLEPTTVAVRIADKSQMRVGDRVAIVGGGPIGQLALQVMRLAGATSLTMIEPIEARRDLAERFGADHVLAPGDGLLDSCADLTRGRGFDVVIDASGSPRAVGSLLDLAANGGRVVYGAMYPEGFELPVDMARYLYLKELTITGVFISPYTFPRALSILPRLDLGPFVESVYPLEQAKEAFAAHLAGESLKVLIDCGAEGKHGD